MIDNIYMLENIAIICFIEILLIILLYKLSFKINLLDHPNKIKSHIDPIPLIGGIAIYLGILCSIFLFDYNLLILKLIYTSSLIILLGLVDDYINLNSLIRLLLQICISTIIYLFGFKVINIGIIPGVGYFSIYDINSYIFTIVSLITLINAFNFQDGIDGLATTNIIISLILFCLMSYFFSIDVLSLNIILIIIVLSLVFLLFNFSKKYKIFLGSSGSYFYGFFYGSLIIYISQNNSFFTNNYFIIWFIFLPVMDMLSLFILRISNKRNPMLGDRNHIHHLLQKQNYTQLNINLIINFLSLSIILLGLVIEFYYPQVSIILFSLMSLAYIFLKNVYANNYSLYDEYK